MIYWTNQQVSETGPEKLLDKASPEQASVQAAGVFDGATLTLEVSQDGLPFYSLTDFTVTTPSIMKGLIPFGSRYRFVLANSTGSTSVSVSLLSGGK